MGINQIEIGHIESLNSIQLSRLLHSLLSIELETNKIKTQAFVPFNINTGDGGEDGRVKWESGPEKTKWLDSRFCLFQNKATDMSPGDCYSEILRIESDTEKVLKDRIKELVETGGSYILFNNRSLNSQLIDARKLKLQKAIHDAGYSLENINIVIYDANLIKDWVNESIASVTLVQSFNDIYRHPEFLTYDEWFKQNEYDLVPYQKNDFIDNYFNYIFTSLQSRKSVRVIGQSGLGKTRLVYEAFRDVRCENEFGTLKNQLVYLDIRNESCFDNLIIFINSNKNQEGILIIDNCEEENHKLLTKKIQNLTQFKLLTINLNSDTVEENSIQLEKSNQKDIVKRIIEEKLDKHNQTDIEYLTKLCDGYPWMAVNFCDSIKRKGIDNFKANLGKDVIKKLLFGTDAINEVEYKVVRACSVFTSFGFVDNEIDSIITSERKLYLVEQMEFVRTKIFDGSISDRVFFEICKKYKNKDIIERRGTKLNVKPIILAINLAADWIRNTHQDVIKELIEELKGKPLCEQFIQRLGELDQIPEAQELVSNLWGQDSPFGKAEVLNTEWGSLLFRYVVDVNPISTVKALEKEFCYLSKEELRKITTGRRNLVWALEKLCFRKDTFFSAAKVLLTFAVSENETWSNNATGQFKHLFQVRLSGTEADLSDRLKIIKYGLEKKDDDYNRILILAMENALKYGYFSRSGIANCQGSSVPLKDYTPETYGEMFSYWIEIIKILTDFACENSCNSDLAKEKLAHSYNTLVRFDMIDIIEDSAKKVTKSTQNTWLEGINALKDILFYEKDKIKEDIKIKIDKLISEITPVSIESKLEMIVTKSEWHSREKDKNGNYINNPWELAQKLADQIVQDRIDIVEYIAKLMVGEQRQAFSFGYRLGVIIDDKDIFVDKCIDIIRNLPRNEINIDLIAGFVKGSNSLALKNKVNDCFFENEELFEFAFKFIKLFEPEFIDIEKLFFIVDKGASIFHFNNFIYGNPLRNFTLDDLMEFASKLAKYKPDGVWVAFSIFHMYCFSNREKIDWNAEKNYMKEFIKSQNLLVIKQADTSMDFYNWSEYVKKILEDEIDNDFAIIICKQILELCQKKDVALMHIDQIKETIKILLKKYFDSTWSLIISGLMSSTPDIYFNLEHLLETLNGNFRIGVDLFDDDEVNFNILTWLNRNKLPDVSRLISIFPTFLNFSETVTWHPLTKIIIDIYGDDEKVLSSIGSHMNSFGYTGSLVPYYKDQIKNFEQLQDHSFENVKHWAISWIDYLEKRIKKTIIEEEDDGLR